MTSYIGEFAALGTACCFAITSISFSNAGRLVGSSIVNRTRLLLALVIISVFHLVTLGSLLPTGAESYRWGWLALSGLVGLVLGDALLFQAFVMIGARLSMLLTALSPVMSVILGWTLLNETLGVAELGGIALAVGGVIWVVTERTPQQASTQAEGNHRYYLYGILFGLGGAGGQALGLILSKKGLDGDFPALSGNVIRILISTSAIWMMALAQGQGRRNFQTLNHEPRAIRWIVLGSILGPFLGVWLSLVAVQKAPVGIASTLMALTPIILLPIGYILYHERYGLRTVLGTLLAVVGTVVIFVSG